MAPGTPPNSNEASTAPASVVANDYSGGPRTPDSAFNDGHQDDLQEDTVDNHSNEVVPFENEQPNSVPAEVETMEVANGENWLQQPLLSVTSPQNSQNSSFLNELGEHYFSASPPLPSPPVFGFDVSMYDSADNDTGLSNVSDSFYFRGG
jgi:hypothetical protein